jgi:predicted RNA-binding protein with PIN domain
VVDGHNVLHAWPDWRGKLRTPRQRHLAQQELLQRLRHYQDMTDSQVVVVFDGTQTRTHEEREPEGLQIFYADANTTADALIERLAAKYAKGVVMRVASADGLIRDAILAGGAEWVSPEMLRLLCEEAEADMRSRIDKNRS